MNNTLGHLMEKNVSEVFGQRDSARRKVAISEVYAEDCTFFEAEEQFVGREALNARAERILQDSPGFVFRAVGSAEVNHDLGRLQWQFGPPGAHPVVTGMDIAVFEQGRIRALTPFSTEKEIECEKLWISQLVVKQREKKETENHMLRVAIILGSSRPGRNGEAVAKWVYDIAKKRTDAEFEYVDIKDYNLPLYDEPIPGQYTHEHTKRWADKIDSFDAFVFITAEYNHGIPGALKNAIDFLYKEWNNKVAGFVSYGGGALGTRAVEQLRLVMAELQVATVRAQVTLSLFTDFENFSTFKPAAFQEQYVNNVLDQVIAWGSALKAPRTKKLTEYSSTAAS
jgi:NAD(P)H-dependent FMN reductase